MDTNLLGRKESSALILEYLSNTLYVQEPSLYQQRDNRALSDTFAVNSCKAMRLVAVQRTLYAPNNLLILCIENASNLATKPVYTNQERNLPLLFS